MAYRFGKHPPIFDARTLRFEAYLRKRLPPPPPHVDYGAKVPAWPMYENDQYGDCTCAAAGHMIQAWTANAGSEITPSDDAVLAFYEHFVGNPPPPDAGCNMLPVLRYWRTAGLGGHRVLAFASLRLRSRRQAMDALFMFGGVYVGVALPDFAAQKDALTVPWIVPASGAVGDAAPNPNNGHCVSAVSYDADNLYVVTWGEIKPMSWDFYDAYTDEAYAVLSRDFIEKSGKNVAGFDLDMLTRDLAKFTPVA